MTTPEADPGVRVTLRDVWTELRALADAVRDLSHLAHQVADQERRTRAIERWLYALPVALVLTVGEIAQALWRH